MYPVVYDRVHICTQSYTTAYIYVPSRIRQSTYMYPVVYGRVHICTYSYTTGYICVLCRVRPCVYIFANFDPYQFNLRTEDLTRIYPSWSTQRPYTFDHGQFPWCDRPPRAVRSYSWSTQRPYTFDHWQFPWCDRPSRAVRSYRGNRGIVRAWTMDVTSAMPVNSFRSWTYKQWSCTITWTVHG